MEPDKTRKNMRKLLSTFKKGKKSQGKSSKTSFKIKAGYQVLGYGR